jgi:hypothetical protein
MHEESIYRILDRFQDPDEAELLQKQQASQKLLMRKREYVLPTASTFINHTTCRPGIANMGGERNPLAVLQQHRGSHATFGLPKGLNKAATTSDFKSKRHQILPPVTKFDYKDKVLPKPPVPAINEAPMLGLSSNVNFIHENRRRAMSLKPKPRTEPANFLKKKDFGQSPEYLETVKSTINKEMEYLNMISQAQNRQVSSKYELPKDDVEELKAALMKKYNEVNKEYQGITHVSKVYSEGIKRRKERCEKELAQIERDLKLLNKENIFVDCRN